MGTDHRVQSLRERLQEEDLDAILISSAENRRYLSGFAGSAGFLLISRNESVLLTDFRYTEQAGNQAPDFRIERIKGGLDWFPEITSELKVGRLGFEGQDVTFSAHSAFNKALDEAENASSVEMVSTSGIVEEIRAFKDEDELNLLTRAIELSDQAIERITPTIEPGVTEGEVAWELEKAMRESGSENVAFDIIVGAGPNGALPHHRAGDKAIEKGEAIVIDMGARYEGYNSDLTRTVIVGEPDETFRKVYDTVLHAQLTAIEKVTNGMTGEEADAISRDIIAEAGYGENFGHSLGHGVGLAVHENPRLGPKSKDVLENGMAFTIEPGIYLSGWGGVRIEDIVVLENGRARVISKARK
jgi:Xaa-Pro aminopeptidase